MNNEPTPRNASIVTKEMLARIIFSGLYISVIFMLQTMCNILDGTPEQSKTILFTLFVGFQLVNAFSCREFGHESIFKHFFDNKMMLVAFFLTFLLQFAISQYGGFIFGTVPLPAIMWAKIIGLSVSVLVATEIFKFTMFLFQKVAKK